MNDTSTIHNPRSEIRNLVGRGLFGNIDIHFADFIAKIAGDTGSDELYLASALLSNISTMQQHVCLDLCPENNYSSLLDFFADFSWMEDEERGKLEKRLRDIPVDSALIGRIRDCKVIGHAGTEDAELKPIILDGNRIYLQRYWQYEQKLANLIRARAVRAPVDGNIDAFTGRIRAISQRFRENSDEIDWQQVAAFAVLNNDFSVITGGPGTGKTTVVTAIVALLLQNNPKLKISLCAPTGKAQARLQEAIVEETANLNCDASVTQIISKLRASTIHRLLRTKKDTPFFWRNAENQLDTDILIVDEVSMVSQPLMAKMFMAVPDHARIVLLGDKDQLASVEIGSILGDICDASQLNQFSPGFVAKFAEVTAHSMPGLPATDSGSILVDCAVELVRSHRFHPDKGISKLKTAVNENNAERALSVLESDESGEVTVRDLPARNNNQFQQELAKYLNELRITGSDDAPDEDGKLYCAYATFRRSDRAEEVDEAYRLFRESVILCSHRSGMYGVENVNRVVRRIMKMTRDYCRGLPVMVTTNDYHLNLFNGDVGLCWPDEDDVMKVHFPNPSCVEGGDQPKYRMFSPSQLPEHEVVFAMTVHKAQGSGFQRVLMILPDKHSPLLTSELIYTGITRARKHVELWTRKDILEQAITENIKRSSGLKDQLCSFVKE